MLQETFYVINSYQKLLKHFSLLKRGDLIFTRIPVRNDNFHLILDLEIRGVLSFPSFLSQILSVSKIAQAEILRSFMPPYTYVIKNQSTLLSIFQNPPPYKRFVTKRDQANCGLGIKIWRDLEEVFNWAGTPGLEFPFVLQPFFEDWRDLRIIYLGNLYREAYERRNKKNFRQNLFFGGEAFSYKLSKREIEFCEQILNRGLFPYAHLDLAYIEGEGPYLSEINLKGGIKGAQINASDYQKILLQIQEEFFNNWRETHSPFQVL